MTWILLYEFFERDLRKPFTDAIIEKKIVTNIKVTLGMKAITETMGVI